MNLSKTKKVLITGHAQSGKSSSASYFKYYLDNIYQAGHLFKEYSFAEPLKHICVDILGLQHNQCYGSNDDKNQPTHINYHGLLQMVSDTSLNGTEFRKATGREVMQIFGTNICRELSPDCWASNTAKRIASAPDPHFAVVSDVRFPNELDILLDENTYVIRLHRDIIKSDHASETALDKYDWGKIRNFYPVDNTGFTIEEKNNLLDGIFEKIIHG